MFLLEGQREAACPAPAAPSVSVPGGGPGDAEERSYVLLLFSPVTRAAAYGGAGGQQAAAYAGCALGAGEEAVVRVWYRALVVGLLAHQLLLHSLGALLLRGTPHAVPSLANVVQCGPAAGMMPGLPGLMRCLTPDQLEGLLAALDVSYYAALQFDARPGLKFLVQKVAGLDSAANLYRQAAAAWTIKVRPSIMAIEV